MKKIISIIVACLTVMCFCITCSAQEVTKTFSMMSNTGIITLRGQSAVELCIEPDIIENDSIILYNNGTIPNITSVKLDVEGLKYYRNYTISNSYEFKNYEDRACTLPTNDNSGDYWKLDIYVDTSPVGAFLTDIYEEIYSIGITVTAYFETDSSKVYYDWTTGCYLYNDSSAFDIVKYFDNENDLTAIIEGLADNIKEFKYIGKEVKNDYAFLPNTDRDRDGIIYRTEVDCLSYSRLGTGWGLKGFEGLASQVSTFFNKQNNGKIIFKITTAPSVMSSYWYEGGIPSTQIGFYDAKYLKNYIIGLFFNYDTTGSLMSQGMITDDGYIVFDISNVLQSINGYTMLSINSIYYGMVGGINYLDIEKTGFKIEEVTLSYDDGSGAEVESVFPIVTTEATTTPIVTEISTTSSVTSITTTDTSIETTTTIPEEEIEEPIDVEDDEDKIIIIVEDNITTTTTAAQEVTTPAQAILIEEIVEEDDDVNPGTGTALAIIPMIGAVITAIVTKRKL